MKQIIITQKERAADRPEIIALVGKDAYRRMVARKWQLRKIERTGK